MKNGTASNAKALIEPNRFWCSAASGTLMKKTSATVTDDSSTRKIGNPSRSRMTGSTPSANHMSAYLPAPHHVRPSYQKLRTVDDSALVARLSPHYKPRRYHVDSFLACPDRQPWQRCDRSSVATGAQGDRVSRAFLRLGPQ